MGQRNLCGGHQHMRTRQRADGKDVEEGRRGRKYRQRAKPEVATLATSSASERLSYIAAIVQELKIISAGADCPTLTSLLDLAYQEALERRRGLQ
jgi:hypothetical protein